MPGACALKAAAGSNAAAGLRCPLLPIPLQKPRQASAKTKGGPHKPRKPLAKLASPNGYAAPHKTNPAAVAHRSEVALPNTVRSGDRGGESRESPPNRRNDYKSTPIFGFPGLGKIEPTDEDQQSEHEMQ